MKSKGKKFLSALLVSSMVLTSSLGFMPRTAQATDTVYSYGFEYVNTVTNTGDKEIHVTFDSNYALNGIDTTKFKIISDSGADTTATIGQVEVAGQTLKIEIQGVDPSETGYTLMIEAGGIKLDGNSFGDIPIQFKSYDITPGFKSIFQDATAANNVFADNSPEDITIYVNSGYLRTLTATNYNDLINWTAIEGTTENTTSVEVEVVGISGADVQTATVDGEGKFSTLFSDVSGDQDVKVRSYDANGKLLEEVTEKINFSDSEKKGTTFKEEQVRAFDSEKYTVQQILDGTDITVEKLVDGLTFDQLDQLQVHYKGVDTFYEVGSETELTRAMLDINSMTGKSATIKLTNDFSVSSEKTLKNDELLIINGMGHTITGDLKLGDPANKKTVKLANINVVGNVTVDVGDSVGANAYLNDVEITSGELIVKSGSYSSVYLTNVIVPKMVVDNTTDVHILAITGTAIGETELKGDKKVKLTMNGGSFGANIVDKKSDGLLELDADKNVPEMFTQLTIDATATNAEVRLLENTVLNKLVANAAVDIVGVSSSLIENSSESTAKITYDGFKITDATDDTDKYVKGPNVPSNTDTTASTITVPNGNKNAIRLGGTVFDQKVDMKELREDELTLTLTIIKSGSDPTTMLWIDTLNEDQVFSLLNLGGLTLAKDDFTSKVVNGNKTLEITFVKDQAVLTENGDFSIDPTKFVETLFKPDKSVVGTEVWGDAYKDSSFSALYKPSISGTDKFTAYKYADLDDLSLLVDKELTDVQTATGGTIGDYEYRFSDETAWSTLVTTNILATNPGVAKDLLIRVKGGDEKQREFNLEPKSPWFNIAFAAPANSEILREAVVDPLVEKIHFEGGVDFDGSDATSGALTPAEYTILNGKSLAYVAEGSGAATVKNVAGAYEGLIGTVGDVTPSAAPTLIAAEIGLDPDDDGWNKVDDTLVLTFSEDVAIGGTLGTGTTIANLNAVFAFSAPVAGTTPVFDAVVSGDTITLTIKTNEITTPLVADTATVKVKTGVTDQIVDKETPALPAGENAVITIK